MFSRKKYLGNLEVYSDSFDGDDFKTVKQSGVGRLKRGFGVIGKGLLSVHGKLQDAVDKNPQWKSGMRDDNRLRHNGFDHGLDMVGDKGFVVGKRKR